MKIFRIYLRGWTASFRYPCLASGFQPTLPVPPLSTIYGLFSAAKGNFVTPQDTDVGFVFQSQAKTVDLETIYELSANLQAKSNVCRREFLFNPELYLYTPKKEFADFFRRPHYPLLLGRSTDPAMVVEIKEIELQQKDQIRLVGCLLPFPTQGIYGPISALPTYFSDTIPRKAIHVRPFYLVNDLTYTKQSFSSNEKDETENSTPSQLWLDEEKDWGVWIHKM